MRKTSLTLPTSLKVASSWLRSGFQAVIPAESWPRFCMSSSIRGINRATSPAP